jgi:hypothetical protein
LPSQEKQRNFLAIMTRFSSFQLFHQLFAEDVEPPHIAEQTENSQTSLKSPQAP